MTLLGDSLVVFLSQVKWIALERKYYTMALILTLMCWIALSSIFTWFFSFKLIFFGCGYVFFIKGLFRNYEVRMCCHCATGLVIKAFWIYWFSGPSLGCAPSILCDFYTVMHYVSACDFWNRWHSSSRVNALLTNNS